MSAQHLLLRNKTGRARGAQNGVAIDRKTLRIALLLVVLILCHGEVRGQNARSLRVGPTFSWFGTAASEPVIGLSLQSVSWNGLTPRADLETGLGLTVRGGVFRNMHLVGRSVSSDTALVADVRALLLHVDLPIRLHFHLPWPSTAKPTVSSGPVLSWRIYEHLRRKLKGSVEWHYGSHYGWQAYRWRGTNSSWRIPVAGPFLGFAWSVGFRSLQQG